MKLELERLEYEREETGTWLADFSVRNENNMPVLRFSEHCRGSSKGHQVSGWKQELNAEQALKKLFDQARETLKKTAAAT